MALITINIDKKAIMVLFLFLLVSIITGFTIAYNSGGPPNIMGHSIEELQGVQRNLLNTCLGNEIVKSIDPSTGAVTCSPIPALVGLSCNTQQTDQQSSGGGCSYQIALSCNSALGWYTVSSLEIPRQGVAGPCNYRRFLTCCSFT